MSRVVSHAELIEDETLAINRIFAFLFIVVLVVGGLVFDQQNRSRTSSSVSINQVLVIFIMLLAAMVIQFFKHRKLRAYNLSEFVKSFRKDTFNYDAVVEQYRGHGQRHNSVVPKQNVIIFSGFFPFAGSGIRAGGWSFAINTEKQKETLAGDILPIAPFVADELYEAVREELNDLEFQSVSIREVICISGLDIWGNSDFLRYQGSPKTSLDHQVFQQYKNGKNPVARPYLWIAIPSEDEEIIVSMFLRLVRKRDNLFIELSKSVLPPIDNAYRSVDHRIDRDKKDEKDSQEKARQVGVFVAETIVSLLASPWHILTFVLNIMEDVWGSVNLAENLKEAAALESVYENPRFNYGALPTIREATSSKTYTRYFHLLDQEMIVKMFERKILDTVLDFLEQHNIDTSDVRERRNTILNNGVIVQGGNVQTENLAVGFQATATQQIGQVVSNLAANIVPKT